MSLNNELNSHFISLISGDNVATDLNILKCAEEAFYKEEQVFLKRFLGVLYFFNNEYLLSYLLLKGEKDNISKFYYVFSLLNLGYRSFAIEVFSSFQNDSILREKQINIKQRAMLAFLLRARVGFNDNAEDQLTRSLITIVSKKSAFDITDDEKNVIFNSFNQQLINELSERLTGKKDIERQNLNIIKNNYSDSFLELVSYSENIGNNMTLLKVNGKTFIVDCGADIKNPSISFDEFFAKCNVKKEDVDAVFFTHAHLDHVGNALNLINYLGGNVNCYLSVDTMQLAGHGNQVYLDERNHLRFITPNIKVPVANSVDVTFLNNGHILGSTALLFESEGKKIFFTSDFCLHDQSTVPGMNLRNVLSFCGHDIDYLVTESTYGMVPNSLKYEDVWELYKIILSKLFKYNKNVFMPAYSIGRSQELFNGINECEDLNSCSINILGSANNVTLYYKNLNRCGEKKAYSDRDNPLLYDFIIASSGMLVDETESNVLAKSILKDNLKNVVLIQTGYIPPNQEGSEIIKEWKESGRLFFEVGLSAHASNNEIHRLIDTLNPRIIISIHGDGIE